MGNQNNNKGRNKSQGKSSLSLSPATFRRMMENVAEKKVASVTGSAATITSAGTVINLSNGIIEGDDIGNRSGTQVRISKQLLRFNFRSNVTSQSARVIVFRDLFNQGTTPAVVDILPAITYLSHYSDVRQLQQRRFSIIFDFIVDVSVNGEANKTVYKTSNKQCLVSYNGPTAVASSNGAGAVFMLVIGSISSGNYDYDWQCQFNDS